MNAGRMEDMLVTPDVIGVLIAAATLVGGLFAGIAGLLSRQTTRLEARFDARFERIDVRFGQVDARLDRIESDVNDLKVAVARLEGPLPRLSLHR